MLSREWRSCRGQREEDEVSSPLAGTGEISGCDGLETSRPRAQKLEGFWDAIGLSCFCEFLNGQPTPKIHDSLFDKFGNCQVVRKVSVRFQ